MGDDWGRDVAGLVVVILATALGVFLLFGAVDLTIGAIKGKTLNPDAADLLSSILGAVVGVLATFVGLRSGVARRHDRRRQVVQVVIFIAIAAASGALVELVFVAVRWWLGG